MSKIDSGSERERLALTALVVVKVQSWRNSLCWNTRRGKGDEKSAEAALRLLEEEAANPNLGLACTASSLKGFFEGLGMRGVSKDDLEKLYVHLAQVAISAILYKS